MGLTPPPPPYGQPDRKKTVFFTTALKCEMIYLFPFKLFLKLKTFKMLQILWLSARFRNGFNYSVRFVCLFGESIGGTSPVIGVCFLYTRTPFIRSERYALGIISTNQPTSHDSYLHLFLFFCFCWRLHGQNTDIMCVCTSRDCRSR